VLVTGVQTCALPISWSGWVKLGQISTTRALFSCVVSGTETTIYFGSDNKLFLLDYQAGAFTGRLQTTQVFRDPSAWYHIVLAVDSTQATAANRAKLYVNGVLVSSLASTLTSNMLTAVYVGSAAAGTLPFSGTIDEPRIYNRALSAEEVQQIYLFPTYYEALPIYPNQEGFAENPKQGLLRSTVDAGPEKVRRRYTAISTIYSIQYALTYNQKQVLDYFYKYVAKQGALRFNWTHPIGYTVEARFQEPPQYTPRENEITATLQLEVLA
jgi:hypothetical protein